MGILFLQSFLEAPPSKFSRLTMQSCEFEGRDRMDKMEFAGLRSTHSVPLDVYLQYTHISDYELQEFLEFLPLSLRKFALRPPHCEDRSRIPEKCIPFHSLLGLSKFVNLEEISLFSLQIHPKFNKRYFTFWKMDVRTLTKVRNFSVSECCRFSISSLQPFLQRNRDSLERLCVRARRGESSSRPRPRRHLMAPPRFRRITYPENFLNDSDIKKLRECKLNLKSLVLEDQTRNWRCISWRISYRSTRANG